MKNMELLRQKRERIAQSKEARKQYLDEVIQKGQMYEALLQNNIWKAFLNDYLDEQMDPQRLLGYLSNKDKMYEEAIKIQALWEMMAYITQQVKDAYRASQELAKL